MTRLSLCFFNGPALMCGGGCLWYCADGNWRVWWELEVFNGQGPCRHWGKWDIRR